MRITVIGSGRWGSFIAYYLRKIGNEVTVGAKPSDDAARRFDETRSNGVIVMPEDVKFVFDVRESVKDAETVVISIPSQNLRSLLEELGDALDGKILILCMKGIEIETGKRLTEVVKEIRPAQKCAVWVGPGHPQEFAAGKPNCMVIDSEDKAITEKLVDEFSSELIRFYYGEDLIGTEIGAAAKNVIGIAAGFLDGMGYGALKGALMARGAREIARLIGALGGNENSAYGLCHLGDYEATVFSKFSHNRAFGESFVKGESYELLAEGAYTVKAMMKLKERCGVELPICTVVNDIIYNGQDVKTALSELFKRPSKTEFYK